MTQLTPPPHVQLAVMSRAYVVSRGIHVLARLGIADHMSQTPTPVADLARLTHTKPDLLKRLLNFLSLYDLFIKEGDSFALTPLSAPLQTNHPQSIKAVLALVDASWWNAFSELENTLKTGEPAFDLHHGCHFFEYLLQHPEVQANYEKGLDRLSELDDPVIVKALSDLSFNTMTVVGSTGKALAQRISTQYPDRLIHAITVAESISTPLTCDSLLLKAVLHDLNSQELKQYLQHYFEVLPDSASLMIAEQVITDDHTPHTNKTMDLILMTLVGGQQCTLTQWKDHVESAGFTLYQIKPTEGLFTLMVFKKS